MVTRFRGAKLPHLRDVTLIKPRRGKKTMQFVRCIRCQTDFSVDVMTWTDACPECEKENKYGRLKELTAFDPDDKSWKDRDLEKTDADPKG